MNRFLLYLSFFVTYFASGQNTAIPDPAFEQFIIDQGWDIGVPDGFVPTANINTRTNLNINNTNITDFTGLNAFAALNILRINNNPSTNQTSLFNNINALPVLNRVTIQNSGLTGVITLVNPAFVNVDLQQNAITTVNVTTGVNVEQLTLFSNDITVLNIIALTKINALILRSNTNLGNYNFSNLITLTTLDVTDTGRTTLDVTQNTNLESLTAANNTLNTVDLSLLTNLTRLNLSGNQITSLDVSNNLLLQSFTFSNNLITAINILNNTALTDLNGGNNLITSLNLSGLALLSRVDMASNAITSLNVMGCASITNLRMDNNDITSIDFSQMPLLRSLQLERNELITADLSTNLLLDFCWIRFNNMTSIIFPATNTIRSINVYGNQLTSIVMPPAGIPITYLGIGINRLSDQTILDRILTYTNLGLLGIDNNLWTGTVPNLSAFTNLDYYDFSNCLFQYGDWENEHATYLTYRVYGRSPQAKLDTVLNETRTAGQNITMVTNCTGSQNHYAWYKNGTQILTAPDSPSFTITNVQTSDSGTYYCRVSSDIVTNMFIQRNDIFLNVTGDTAPDCTTVINPLNNSTNIPINANITWTASPRATGYRLSIGTTSGATNILNNVNVGNVTTYNPTIDFLNSTQYFIIVTPFNIAGDAATCSEVSFTTVSVVIPLPDCTVLTTPLVAETNVAVNTDISWNAALNASGYFISYGTNTAADNIVANFDNGNSLTYNPTVNFPNNTPIFVSIIPYNATGSAIGCSIVRFTTIVAIPDCTTANFPADNAINIPINTNISWASVATATGYRLSIGTGTGTTNILNNIDLGNIISYSPNFELLNDTQYFISVIPYNEAGNATACVETSFRTQIAIPNCTTVTLPSNNATNIAVDTNISWASVSTASGYKISIGTNNGLTDVLDNLDVANLTTYNPIANFLNSTQYFISITPYNTGGEALDCTDSTFTTIFTEIKSLIIPNYFTPNQDNYHDLWTIEDPNDEIAVISIFDRFGKLLKQGNASLAWDGNFNNEPLPSSDYWYVITLKDNSILRGHFSLKR